MVEREMREEARVGRVWGKKEKVWRRNEAVMGDGRKDNNCPWNKNSRIVVFQGSLWNTNSRIING